MTVSFDVQNPCLLGTPPAWPQKAILWEITNRCNLHCKHCCNASAQVGAYGLSTDILIETILHLPRLHVCEVYLSGGEPLCRSDLAEIVGAITVSGIKASLATNGTLLDRPRLEALLEAGIGQINISLDSSVPHQHDMFRGEPGAFQKATRAIELCVEYHVSSKVVCTLTRKNWAQAESLVQLLIHLGVQVVVFNVVQPSGRIADHPDYVLDSRKTGLLVDRMRALTHNYARDIEVDFRSRASADGKPLGPCPGGRSLIHVTAEGQVYPCSWIAKLPSASVYKLGDISHTPLEELEARGLEVTEPFLHRGDEIALCQTCEWRQPCGYGCPLPILRDESGVTLVDPICPKCNKI